MPVDEDGNPTAPTVLKEEHLRRLAAKQTQLDAQKVKLDAATSKLADLEARLATTPDAGKAAKRLERAESELTKTQGDFDAYRAETETRSAIMAAGVTDPEDIDLVRYRHGKLPEDGRPNLSTWLAGGAKEDRIVKRLFNGAGGEGTTEQGAGTTEQGAGPGDARATAPAGLVARRAVLPAANAQVKPDTGPAQPWSMEHIMAMPYPERNKPENRVRIMEALKGKT